MCFRCVLLSLAVVVRLNLASVTVVAVVAVVIAALVLVGDVAGYSSYWRLVAAVAHLLHCRSS